MAKKEQFAVRLPPAALKMVDKLVGSVYGTNRSDVARGLIVDQLKQLAAQDLVEWIVESTKAEGEDDT
jgi:hypothetical protein